MPLDNLTLIAIGATFGPWAVLVAVILYARSRGQFSDQQDAKQARIHAELLRNAQQHELDLLRQNVDTLKRLVIAREELDQLKRSKSA